MIERTEAWSGKGRFESLAGDWNGRVTTVSSCEGGDDDFERREYPDVFLAWVDGESAVVHTRGTDFGFIPTWAVRNTQPGIVYWEPYGASERARIIEEVR